MALVNVRSKCRRKPQSSDMTVPEPTYRRCCRDGEGEGLRCNEAGVNELIGKLVLALVS